MLWIAKIIDLIYSYDFIFHVKITPEHDAISYLRAKVKLCIIYVLIVHCYKIFTNRE